MSLPTSHKSAPFLTAFEPNCKGPIAGYASYCMTEASWRGANGDVAIQSPSGLLPTYAKASADTRDAHNDDRLHLPNSANFFQEVFSRKFDQLLDLFCVDLESNLRLYYLFCHSRPNYHFQISFDIADNDPVPSLSWHYASANWLERECFDLFGVRFENHPHLKRLLMYPEFAGHPLRKNYPIDKAQPLIPIYA